MQFDFTNSSGETLSGRLEKPKSKIRAYALFAHCFTCSKDLVPASVISKQLTEHGIAVLRFDFTGLASSEGDFANTNFSSNVGDLIDAYRAIADQFEAPKLLIGHSLGGAAVLKAATKLPDVKAVVTIGAPSSVNHVAHLFEDDLETIKKEGEAKVHLAGRPFLIKKQFIDDIEETSVLEGIKSFKKSLLVLHSPIDNTVSVDHAANIFLAAKHPKSFVSLDTADHLLMNRDDAHYAAHTIGAWVARYLDSKKEKAPARPVVGSGEVLVSNRPGKKFTHDIFTDSNHIIADEPTSLQGANLGMSPYELLLASLGGCTAMTLRMYADRKEMSLDKVEVRLRHKKIHATDCQECETQTGLLDQIDKEILIEGDLSPEQRTKLFEIAEKCPVNRTLNSEIRIISHYF